MSFLTRPKKFSRQVGSAWLGLLIGLACIFFGISSASSAEAPWKTKTVQFVAENQKLPDLLREFIATQGMPVIIAPEIEGTVNAKFDLPPARMMDVLAASYGLIWYYDGAVIYIYPSSAMRSELVRVSASRIVDLLSSLERLKILDQRFPVRFDFDENTLLVAGPPRYVEMILSMTRFVDDNATRRGTAEIRVFPLKYAWAADTKFSYNGEDVVFPGLVNTLRDMFEIRSSASQGQRPGADGKKIPGSTTATSPVESMKKLQGTGLQIPIPGAQNNQPQDKDIIKQNASNQTESFDVGLPRFRADSRMNAVLIRDLPERMGQYEKLIAQLDVRPGIVEIEANILEVSSDELEQLGVEWRLGRGDVQGGFGGLSPPPVRLENTVQGLGAQRYTGPVAGLIPPPANVSPVGGLVTLLSGDARQFLIARVNALAQNGKASISARPKILTLDNVEALLDNSTNFSVRVAGNLEVGLFNVNVGTSLRVTPLIVTEGELRLVKLAVRIEDGSQLPQAVDGIPATRRSTIGTQTFVREGESLLIAGYSNDTQSKRITGIPVLSKIPGIGPLFRTTDDSAVRLERLFLITPRIVPM